MIRRKSIGKLYKLLVLAAVAVATAAQQAAAAPKKKAAPPPPPPKRVVHIANVPFVSQVGAPGCKTNNLCSQCSGVAVAGWAWGKKWATISNAQSMAVAQGKGKCGGKGSSQDDTTFGLRWLNGQSAAWIESGTIDQMKEVLARGIPVSVDLTYSELGNYREDKKFGGGHTVVVIGFDEKNSTWTIRDPLANKSKDTKVPSATFRAAVEKIHGGQWVRWLRPY